MLCIVAGITLLVQPVITLKENPDYYRSTFCPHCGREGVWNHGHYDRKSDRSGELNPILIPRFFVRIAKKHILFFLNVFHQNDGTCGLYNNPCFSKSYPVKAYDHCKQVVNDHFLLTEFTTLFPGKLLFLPFRQPKVINPLRVISWQLQLSSQFSK